MVYEVMRDNFLGSASELTEPVGFNDRVMLPEIQDDVEKGPVWMKAFLG